MPLQLGFEDAPVASTPADLNALMHDAGPVVTDPRVMQRIHRRSFQKMDPNKRSDGKVVTYRITIADPGETEAAPARQEIVTPSKMTGLTLDRINERVRAAKAIQNSTLDGREVVQVRA